MHGIQVLQVGLNPTAFVPVEFFLFFTASITMISETGRLVAVQSTRPTKIRSHLTRQA
jgi:hypothetical protein